jgi:hypothetical protein
MSSTASSPSTALTSRPPRSGGNSPPPIAARRPPLRCEVPAWLPTLRASLTQELASVEARCAEAQAELSDLRSQLAIAQHQFAIAQRGLKPYQPSIDQAVADAREAQERTLGDAQPFQRLKGRHRRSAEREHRIAMVDLAAAKQREADGRLVARPATDVVNAAAGRDHEIRQSITFAQIVLQWTAGPEQVQQHRDHSAAVDDWERWATGEPVEPARLASILDTLRSDVAAERTRRRALR